ncbi:peptidylprolyl isomerase [Marinobacterium nitratireducens]|uniref:peptidylprolyl isomerase n=1 Tax=Marinobacterium nitratireducens TaxID=518897 RepID=A0A917Z6N2_9GAMM|nr:peptidylprolyl isomerase [Marinobacterium nitratireducens]GGO76567.1 peptidylprolyl isomerase [Marinobacterium nitratireducens]
MQLIDTRSLPAEAPEFDEVYVNGTPVSEESIAQEMQYHPADSAEAARREAVQALVVRQLLLNRADELGIEAQPHDGEAVEEARIRQLLHEEVDLPQAGGDDCRRYFDANPQKFRTPDYIAASHILLGADPNDPEQRAQRKAEAEALIEQLQQAPERFAELARAHSDCPSKELGGELGQLDKGQTVPEFERQVLSLAEGLCATPVESRYGFHLVRIDKRVPGQPLDYDMVEDRIKAYLREQVYRRGINQYISLLAGQADIRGHEMQAADSLLLQ